VVVQRRRREGREASAQAKGSLAGERGWDGSGSRDGLQMP